MCAARGLQGRFVGEAMPSEHLRRECLLQPEPHSRLLPAPGIECRSLAVNMRSARPWGGLPAAPCLLHGVKVSQSHPGPGLSFPEGKLLLSVRLVPC